MSTNPRSSVAKPANGDSQEKTYFEEQREVLVAEVAQSLEHVLANINKLNRGLEQVIAVGHEFSSVEALWSQFESVMAKDPNAPPEAQDIPDNEEGDATIHEHQAQ